MTFSVAGVATAARGRDKIRTESGFGSEDVVIECNIAVKELPVLFGIEPFNRSVQKFVISRCGGKEFFSRYRKEHHAEY